MVFEGIEPRKKCPIEKEEGSNFHLWPTVPSPFIFFRVPAKGDEDSAPSFLTSCLEFVGGN